MDPKDETNDAATPRQVRSLKKLAQENFTQFAVQIQHVSEEVQKKIIEQIPEFRALASGAIDKVTEAYKETLRSMNKSERQVHKAAQEWRAALVAMLDDPNLSLDDKLRITAEIRETVSVQANLHQASNKSREALLAKVAFVALGVVGVVIAAATGGKIGIGQGGKGA